MIRLILIFLLLTQGVCMGEEIDIGETLRTDSTLELLLEELHWNTITIGGTKEIVLTAEDITSMTKEEIRDLVTLCHFYNMTTMNDSVLCDQMVIYFIPKRFRNRGTNDN